MKRHFVVALTLVALALLTVTTSFAQDKMRAAVPFAFQVGKATLPPGTYTVSKIAARSIVIRNRRQAGQAALINYRDVEKGKPQSPKLIFQKYGQRYFLAEVWNGGTTGMQLPESKWMKEYAGHQVAAADSAIVIVAME